MHKEHQSAPITALVGKILTLVEVSGDKTEIRFECSDGDFFVMRHYQDCCENVIVEDINGDLDDLVGNPILKSEEVSAKDNTPSIFGEGIEEPDCLSSYTWTFYKLATVKGYVTIRWLGESNGYYSEEVDFERVCYRDEAEEENGNYNEPMIQTGWPDFPFS